MAHSHVPEADAILDKEFKVLDKGFVRLVDYMGSDERIAQAARVSYGEGTSSVRNNQGLIYYLMRHQHTSPFEHVVFEFHCKMPIFVARQWVRHRTARLNEISGRYSVMSDEFYVPPAEHIKFQSQDNKQGRATDEVPEALRGKVIELLKAEQSRTYESYRQLIDDNIARELARINLPLSMYTEWYWQMDLHNLFHFLKLRMNAHAQWEIRQYANTIAEITEKVVPDAYRAFEDIILNGAHFSSREMDTIKKLLDGGNNDLTGRTRREFAKKLDLPDD